VAYSLGVRGEIDRPDLRQPPSGGAVVDGRGNPVVLPELAGSVVVFVRTLTEPVFLNDRDCSGTG